MDIIIIIIMIMIMLMLMLMIMIMIMLMLMIMIMIMMIIMIIIIITSEPFTRQVNVFSYVFVCVLYYLLFGGIFFRQKHNFIRIPLSNEY